MIERGDSTSFALEAFAELALASLDGNCAIEPAVTGLVHFTHPARSDESRYFIRAEACSRR
jgi:hypothetical protein